MDLEKNYYDNRVVRSDKKGLYIVHDRKRWRPTGPTVYSKGDRVCHAFYAENHPSLPHDGTEMYVSHHRSEQTTVTPATTTWNKNPKPYRATKWHNEDIEKWECHDADPRLGERLRAGFHKFDGTAERGHFTVVVAGDDGYDYNQFRKDPSGYKPHIAVHSTRGVNVHLHVTSSTSGHVQFTWDQWDALVEKVNSHRDEVKVAPIAMKLQEEIDLEEQLDQYIEEKGLRDG